MENSASRAAITQPLGGFVPETSDPRLLKRTRGGRERLLSAAAELFGKNGFAGTSVQMIADRLGVSKPAIYHHFQSRDDIVRTLMQPVISDARRALEQLAELPVGQRHGAAMEFYAGFVVTHRRVISLVLFDRGAMAQDVAETAESLVDRVAEELVTEHATERLALGVTLVYGAAALVTRHQELDDRELRSLIDSVLASAST